MIRQFTIVAEAGAILLGFAAVAGYEYVDTFEDSSSVGGWVFGTAWGHYEPIGGNPGAYFRDPGLIVFAPRPRTTCESVFTGDYRAAEVLSIGIDLQTFWIEYSGGNRPLSVILVSYNGTPSYYDDDWGVYFVGDRNIPLPGEGWLSYDFAIPSQATALPEEWSFIRLGLEAPNELDWNELISRVDRLDFYFGDPGMVFILQKWDVGCDNARIDMAVSPCPADVNVDWTVDVLDLLGVLGAWGESDVPEDVNGDGVVDVLDLLAILEAWGPCFG